MPELGQMSDADLLRALKEKREKSGGGSAVQSMTDEQIVEALKAKGATPPRPKESQQRGTFVDPLLQGVTLGAWDEIKAGIRGGARAAFGNSGKGFGDLYDEELAETRADLAGFKDRHPIAAMASELGGAATGVVATGGASLVPRLAGTAGKLGAMTAEGAALGGLYGFNAGEGGLENRAKSGAIGAGVGGLTGGVAGSFAAREGVKAAGKAVPTTDALEAQARALYKQAENVGLVVKQPVWNRVVQNIGLAAKSQRLNPLNHPKTSGAVSEFLKSRKSQPTLEDMDSMRRVLKSAERSADPDDARIAGELVDMLDQQIAALSPADVVSGDPKLANSLILKARETWTRKSKGEIVDDIFKNAEIRAGQYSQSGMENALRAEFASLAKSKSRMRQFSKDEKAAIMQVALGGKIDKALRLIGKLAPRSTVSAIPAMGAMTVDPVLGAAVAGVGEVARRGATNMRLANAERAGQIMRSGGSIPAAPLSLNQQRALAAGMGGGLPLGAEADRLLPVR